MNRSRVPRRSEYERLAFSYDPPRRGTSKLEIVMTDQEFAAHLADRAVSEDEHKLSVSAPAPEGAPAGGLRGRLLAAFEAIIAKFTAAGLSVPWAKIIALIQPILAIISGGGSWTAIIAAILALFTTPTPAPVA